MSTFASNSSVSRRKGGRILLICLFTNKSHNWRWPLCSLALLHIPCRYLSLSSGRPMAFHYKHEHAAIVVQLWYPRIHSLEGTRQLQPLVLSCLFGFIFLAIFTSLSGEVRFSRIHINEHAVCQPFLSGPESYEETKKPLAEIMVLWGQE